jgi:hypothetical protein
MRGSRNTSTSQTALVPPPPADNEISSSQDLQDLTGFHVHPEKSCTSCQNSFRCDIMPPPYCKRVNSQSTINLTSSHSYEIF